MSTGLECEFIEVKPGEWFYVLETGYGPEEPWDWREYAQAYGPFPTEEAGFAHLQRNHANPGGYSSEAYHPDYVMDSVMEKLIREAKL